MATAFQRPEGAIRGLLTAGASRLSLATGGSDLRFAHRRCAKDAFFENFMRFVFIQLDFALQKTYNISTQYERS